MFFQRHVVEKIFQNLPVMRRFNTLKYKYAFKYFSCFLLHIIKIVCAYLFVKTYKTSHGI